MIEASRSAAVLNANGLRVIFRQGRTRIKALDGLDLTVHEGEIFGILGPNGAGKSTALNCFLGFLKPHEGEITVMGQTPELGSDLFEEMAYLPEEPHYHPYLTVEEAVTYYAGLYRKNLSGSAISGALDAVGLADYRRLRIEKCSKGMKQKVGIASCMLFEPRVLFLDEPTRGLDPIMVRRFRDHILGLHQRGTTVILNSHVLSEVELICNRIAIINKGRVLVNDLLGNLLQFVGEKYEVVFDPTDSPPDYIEDIVEGGGVMRGQIELADLERLVGYCRENRVRLRSCRAETESLEDMYVRIVEEQKR